MNLFRAGDHAVPELALARRRRWLWLFGLLISLILALVAARPLYRLGKAWRARSLAQEAEQLMAAQKWQEAAGKAYSAFQLSPGVPEASRAVAHLYSAMGSPAALGYWKALLINPAATAADRREGAAFALRAQQLDFASEQLTELLKAEPVPRETLELAVQWAAQRNDRPAALGFIDRLLVVVPDHPGAALWRGQLLYSSPEPAQREQGAQTLQQLAGKPTVEALGALGTLSANPGLSADDLQRVATALENHPLAKIEHRLAAASLRLRAAPEQRATVLEATTALAHSAPENLVPVARWLLQQGEAQRLLALVPSTLALTRQDLFLLHTDALAGLGQWARVRELIEGEKTPLEPLHREIFLARACHELKDDRSAAVHWSKAFVTANQTPAQLLYLAQYAGKSGETEQAEKAWRQLTRNPRYALSAWMALLPIAEAEGNTRGLRDIVRQIVRLDPRNLAARNDAIYLDLLLGENLAAARPAAEQLVKDQPRVLACLTTLALARLREGNSAAALAVYEGLTIDWPNVASSFQAIYLAALQGNGRSDEALVQALATAPLKPEERALLTLPRTGDLPIPAFRNQTGK